MNKLKELLNKKTVKQFIYFAVIVVSIILIWLMGQSLFHIGELLESYELKTYDFRAKMAAENKKHKSDIIILTIDDTSIDVLQESLGRWPWSRDVYAEVINYLISQGVDSVALDLMFVGYQRGFKDKDLYLAETISKYDNVYTSMNFDSREQENPPQLPDYLKVQVENNNKSIDFSYFNFTNANLIIPEIINSTDNIGIINFSGDIIDNVSRRSPTFHKYLGDFYPYLPFKIAADYIEKHENVKIDKYIINEKNQLVFGNRTLDLDSEGNMIINWYGDINTYDFLSFWKAYKSAQNIKNGEEPLIPEEILKDKIVFIGATAVSLYDSKTTPISIVYPGVEIQATVLNNILDNNPVKRVGKQTNLIISIMLGLLVGITVVKIREPVISSVVALFIVVSYVFAASIILSKFSLWIDILNPFVFALLVYIFTFIVKFVLKSKDFEYTYKLATTDGLTNLYNHRYFQEHLKNCMEKATKTESTFSIILIDIDFFKKFNDTYGHQAGDEVLRQVGKALKKCVRSSDLVARYGGEEMVLVLDSANTKEAITVAENVCKNIANTEFELAEGLIVHVTISLGVATYPYHGKTSTELIEFADKGLYKAKEDGRNRVGKTEGLLPEVIS